ncbi:MAG: hypothetical protein IJC09_05170 [Clostridia bacterium]|nr:hypothetical protein [Clostridia bacterium]
MKKIIACISLVFAMSAGVTALAADATYSDDATNTVTMDTADYTTVLIEDAEENILFVDQNDSGFGSAAKFLLKGTEKLAVGTYTVKLGGSSTAASTSTTFTVSSVTPNSIPMTITNEKKNGNTYDYGWFATTDVEDCKFIAITADNGSDAKTVYFDSPFTGTGAEGAEVAVAIKIKGAPEASYGKISVALTNTKPAAN